MNYDIVNVNKVQTHIPLYRSLITRLRVCARAQEKCNSAAEF